MSFLRIVPSTKKIQTTKFI